MNKLIDIFGGIFRSNTYEKVNDINNIKGNIYHDFTKIDDDLITKTNILLKNDNTHDNTHDKQNNNIKQTLLNNNNNNNNRNYSTLNITYKRYKDQD